MPGEDRSFATSLPILLEAASQGHRDQGEGPGPRGASRSAIGHHEVGGVGVAVAAAANATAFFRSFSGFGRRLPYVPLKILPRFDRRSPLPMIHLREKNCATFTDRTPTTN
jgi:hypothetical protein